MFLHLNNKKKRIIVRFLSTITLWTIRGSRSEHSALSDRGNKPLFSGRGRYKQFILQENRKEIFDHITRVFGQIILILFVLLLSEGSLVCVLDDWRLISFLFVWVVWHIVFVTLAYLQDLHGFVSVLLCQLIRTLHRVKLSGFEFVRKRKTLNVEPFSIANEMLWIKINGVRYPNSTFFYVFFTFLALRSIGLIKIKGMGEY